MFNCYCLYLFTFADIYKMILVLCFLKSIHLNKHQWYRSCWTANIYVSFHSWWSKQCCFSINIAQINNIESLQQNIYLHLIFLNSVGTCSSSKGSWNKEKYINPLHAKFFRGNINIYLYFVSFLHIDTTRVVEILPAIRQESTYST